MYKTYLLGLFVLFTFTKSFGKTIDFKTALEQNLVDLTISINEKSTHYHSPFSVSVQNISNKKQSFLLENGTLFIPDLEEYQNFIITEQQILVLEPNENQSVPLKAMCIEKYDLAPVEGLSYQIGNQANPQLCKLSAFVEKNKKYNPDAQFLMWEIANNKYKEEELDLFKINEFDEVEVIDLDENGNEIVLNSFEEPTVPVRELRVNGSFTMNLVSAKNVHIAMFTMENILVKELYNNPETPEGLTKMEYAFNSLEFEEEAYQIKLVVDGEVVMNRHVKMSM